jgi:hypothetical protein
MVGSGTFVAYFFRDLKNVQAGPGTDRVRNQLATLIRIRNS